MYHGSIFICLSGPVQNRSKPVKEKPSCSSGQGSRPGELSSSLPLKMPASDGMLGELINNHHHNTLYFNHII